MSEYREASETYTEQHCDKGCATPDMPGVASGFDDEGTLSFDHLIGGEFPQVMRVVTITGNTLLPRGAVLGRIHSDDDHCRGEDRYRFLSESANCNDGSAMPDAILAQTVDTRCGDQQAYVFLAGEFNQSAVHIPKGHDMEEIIHILRKRSIFIRPDHAAAA